ncbi:conjugal transfer protein TraG N-terminal domain-containing protein [Sphingomonas aurantiaca]
MFPVIFPLFLMPQTGVGALKGYLTGFFYLAAWGPLYVILHMICMTRATSAAQGVAEGGMSLGTYAGIGAVNAETATIAGFMLMSVPFLAAGLAKGAMSISGQATSVLSPAQNAAEAAAAEQTTGNYSYGNTSFANSTSNMRQSNQWSDAPTFSSGGMASSFRHDNGATTNSFGDGQNVYDTSKAISNLPFNASTIQSAMATESRQASTAARIADGFEQASRNETQHMEALRNGHTWSNTTSTAFGASSGSRGVVRSKIRIGALSNNEAGSNYASKAEAARLSSSRQVKHRPMPVRRLSVVASVSARTPMLVLVQVKRVPALAEGSTVASAITGHGPTPTRLVSKTRRSAVMTSRPLLLAV